MAPKKLSAEKAGQAADRPGQSGEDRACTHLRRLGFRILERNYRCRVGEIDVVAREEGTLVFVEVRERGDASRGRAVETVTRAKRRRVARAAELWAAAHGATEEEVRFDVVAIDHEPGTGRALVRHERGAFDADGD